EPLGRMVVADRNHLSLDLTGTNCDAMQLIGLAARVRRPDGDDPDAVSADGPRFLDATPAGKFLSEFEDLAHAARLSRCSAMQAVTDLRSQLALARAELERLCA